MQSTQSHDWDVTPREAMAIQRQLAAQVRLADTLSISRITRVAGVDVGFEQGGAITRAVVVVLSFPQLEYIEHAVARLPTSFPYVPGLLSFRELPAVLQAMQQIEHVPDVVLCDGQGIAHPRRLGIASHLGVLTGLVTIGVGKTRLIGVYDEPPQERGRWSRLMDGDECIGAVLRTRPGVKPIYVSPGHGVSIERSVAITMACTGKYRLPETTRWAHRLASDKRYRQG